MRLHYIIRDKNKEDEKTEPFIRGKSSEIFIEADGNDVIMVHPFVWMNCHYRRFFEFFFFKSPRFIETLIQLFFFGGHRLVAWNKYPLWWPIDYPNEILSLPLVSGEQYVAFSALHLVAYWKKGEGGISSIPMFLQGKKSLKCHVHRGEGKMLLIHNPEKMSKMITVKPNERLAVSPALIQGYFCPAGYIPPLKNGHLIFNPKCRVFLWKRGFFATPTKKTGKSNVKKKQRNAVPLKRNFLIFPC